MAHYQGDYIDVEDTFNIKSGNAVTVHYPTEPLSIYQGDYIDVEDTFNIKSGNAVIVHYPTEPLSIYQGDKIKPPKERK
jgi:glyceraldehyde-3-phosphate dehydrogenase/erythrose-4-phosphate dehydrogenase